MKRRFKLKLIKKLFNTWPACIFTTIMLMALSWAGLALFLTVSEMFPVRTACFISAIAILFLFVLCLILAVIATIIDYVDNRRMKKRWREYVHKQ